MEFADESVEDAQKDSLRLCLNTIKNLSDGWYYNHILNQDNKYGTDWEDGDGDEGGHIDFYISFIMNSHDLDGFLSNDDDDFDEMRMTDFKNTIKSFSK